MVPHLARALVLPVGDLVHQLVREHIPDVELPAVFKQGCGGVAHKQGGLLLVFTYFQLEGGFAYIS